MIYRALFVKTYLSRLITQFFEITLRTVAAQIAASAVVSFIHLALAVFGLGAVASSRNQGVLDIVGTMTVTDMLQAKVLPLKMKDVGDYIEVLSKIIPTKCANTKRGR